VTAVNIDDIKDLCREYGYREVGELHRLEDWLRSRFERLEQLERKGLAPDQIPPEGA
jgi:hypothetical protein